MHPTAQHRGLEWLNQAQNTASRKQPAAREGGKPQSKNKLKEQGPPAYTALGHRAQGCQGGVERCLTWRGEKLSVGLSDRRGKKEGCL